MERASTTGASERDAVGTVLRSDSVPRSLASKYNEYAFVKTYPVGGFAYESVDDWARVTCSARDYAREAVDAAHRAGVIDDHFAETERGMLQSMNACWRDKGFGALVQDSEPHISNPEQAMALRPYLRQLGKEYVAQINSMGRSTCELIAGSTPVQIAKGKGAPLWLSSRDPQLSAALYRVTGKCATWTELERRCQSISNTAVPLAITLYLRLQQSKKPVDNWDLIAGGTKVVRAGERYGPKRRKVQALPWAVNTRFVGHVSIMRELAVANPDRSNTGTITYAAEAVKHYKYSAALDLSGFDDTCGLELIDADRELVVQPVLDALTRMGVYTRRDRDFIAEADYRLNRLSMLAPSPVRGEPPRLIRRSGGIVSGQRDTSTLGTRIVKLRFYEKAAAVGLRDFAFFNSGDDMVIATNDRAGLDRYGAEPIRFGFKETTTPETTYLMRRLTNRGPTGYGYLGRMLLSTINREVMNEHTTLLGFAAAVAVRHDVLTGHPLQHVYFASLLRTGHPRLIAAVRLAQQKGSHKLSLDYARTLSELSPVADDFARLLERTGLSRSEPIAQELARLSGRSTMPLRDLKHAADQFGEAAAMRILRKNVFTTLERK